jgi:anti-sigma-K factor RskA
MNSELECGSDAAAYALGALDAAEAVAFRRHLETCSACQAEIEALQGTVAALPLMVPQVEAPAGLRKRLMADVRADAPTSHRRAARERFPRRRWVPAVPRLAMGGGLSVLIVAVVVAIALSSGSGSGGTRVVSAAVTWTAGRAEVKLSGGRGELVVTGMPAPPAGKIYEVWLKRGSAAPAPTDTLFDPTRGGQAVVDVPGNLRKVSAVMVTAEPRGGSPHPTSSPVIVAKLA